MQVKKFLLQQLGWCLKMILVSTISNNVRATPGVPEVSGCREQFSELDLPRTVLPACSEWRVEDLCNNFSEWENSFFKADSNGDQLVPVFGAYRVFNHYLQETRGMNGSTEEEMRRFMQVVKTDAHVNLEICGDCLMDWNDFKELMWGYTARVLGPIRDESLNKKLREAMIDEIVGNDTETMSSVAVLVKLPRGKQKDYLSTISVHKKRRIAAAALQVFSADERAAFIAEMPDSERTVLLSKREERLDLRGSVHIRPTFGLSDGDFGNPSRRLLASDTNVVCTACSTGTYNSNCDATFSGSCSPCQRCGLGEYRVGCGGNSSGVCKNCSAGTIKNFAGVWSSACISCPLGSFTSPNTSFTSCIFMYTCRMWKDAGFDLSRSYTSNQSVPFENDGITPKITLSRPAYCDMVTDGGGWMLILNYNREGSNVEGLVQGVLPLDVVRGFSHQYVKDFSAGASELLSEVRFYCTSSEHSRVMHFKSRHQGVIGIARRGLTASNSATWWTSNVTTSFLPDHTAMLPDAANATLDDSAATRSLYSGLTSLPFFREGAYHWTIRTSGRWECDNSERYQDDTLHQVWVRG